jgi:hypothetical protein
VIGKKKKRLFNFEPEAAKKLTAESAQHQELLMHQKSDFFGNSKLLIFSLKFNLSRKVIFIGSFNSSL